MRIIQTAIGLALRTAAGALLLAGVSAAQTRTAEIDAERDRKTARLKPETVSSLERTMLEIKEQKIIERITAGYNGLRVKLGGMATSSGFAAGPEFYREDLADGQIRVDASAMLSTRAWQNFQAGITAPHLARRRLAVRSEAVRRDYRALEFYGIGPDSSRGGRTAYRLIDTILQGSGALEVLPRIHIGGLFGGLWTEVRAGRNAQLANTGAVFSESSAPGLTRQSNFLRGGVFGQVDYRDDPAGPKSGGNYVVQYTWYDDRTLDAFSFRRWDIDVQQYIPFFNRTRRIALRGRLISTETTLGHQVPFYLMPTVGGSDDLRGFRPYRFTDRNALIYNAEYRWEIFSGLDGAVFFDAAKVMPKRTWLSASDMEASVGFGLRFNARNRTFIRTDVGFSHEGFGVWIKFNDPFLPRLFGTGTQQPLY